MLAYLNTENFNNFIMKEMVQIMGIDVGTSSTKVLVVNENGNVEATFAYDYPILNPHPDWAEQDPESWWNAAKNAVKKISVLSSVNLADLSAIGLTGQMHGMVLLGRSLKPLRQSIIWADKRSIPQCREIIERIGKEEIQRTLCNPIMPGFMAASLLWTKDNEPSIFRKAFKVLLPKDYVRFKLTGSFVTDVSDASSTLLFDIKRRKWASHILSTLGFSSELFPEVFESVDVAGEVSAEASNETGLPKGLPVIAGGGDSPVGAVGCGAINEGIVSSNIGTGGQIFATLDRPKVDPQSRIHTFCHAVPGKWHLQGAILAAGLSLRWFKENFGQMEQTLGNLCNTDPYDLLSKEAELAEPGCKGLIFVPYLLGERSPHMDPDARGILYGLSLEHRRAHLIRAVMEGVVYALRDSLEIFKELGVRAEKVIARGGGVKSSLWRQIQADIFNAEVMTVNVKEEAAYGAALLAGVGAGIYTDLEKACQETIHSFSQETPNSERAKVYDEYYKIYARLYPALRTSAVS
jgi:xylulokinase